MNATRTSIGSAVGARISSLGLRALRGFYVGYRLCLRDIRTDYSNMVFGLVWEFIEPLVLALIFIYLHSFRAILITDLSIPYGLFVVTGILIWQSFAESLTLAMGSIKRMGGLLGNLRVTPEALMASVIFRQIFNSFFRCVIIFGVVFWYGYGFPANIALFLIAYPAVMLTGLAIGFLVAPFSVVSGDLATIIDIALRPLMFLSGALFPIPSGGIFIWFSVANPAAILIDNLRGLLTNGSLHTPGLFWGTLLASGLLFILAWYVYRVCLRLVSWQT